MKKLLIPFVLLLVGIGGGVGAGLFLAPAPVEELAQDTEHADEEDVAETTEEPQEEDLEAIEPPAAGVEYAKLTNQFIVPILEDGAVKSLVVLSLSIEVELGTIQTIYGAEPKLRDGFLQVMFDHANIGGFSGNYTESTAMRALRDELLRSARRIVGPIATDVLILDILRQDS